MVLYLTAAIILFSATKIHCDTKMWIYTSNILEPQNWETVNGREYCNGLVFAKRNTAQMVIEQLNVKALTLPTAGSLIFNEGSKIVFDRNSDALINCVKLKPINNISWLDITGWNNTDNPNNPAIPYDERPPTRYDDVILQDWLHINFLPIEMEVKSLIVKDGFKQLSVSDLTAPTRTIIKNYWMNGIKLLPENCEDDTGCVTKVNEINRFTLCDILYSNDLENIPVNCQDPIRPAGFCDLQKCGATITIEDIKAGFKLDKINRKLREYTSDTHTSKTSVKPLRIQIFFTEKDFTGNSIVEATEFYNLLVEGKKIPVDSYKDLLIKSDTLDESYFCGKLNLQTSGQSLNERNIFTRNALSVIFGTLLAVIVIFGLLFLTYSPFIASLNIRNRLLGNRPLSTYILRYDNIEDRGYIVDSQSVAGSVQDLGKSFENPMYEEASSSRSTSRETIASVKFVEQSSKIKESIEKMDTEIEEAKELTELGIPKKVEDIKENILIKDI